MKPSIAADHPLIGTWITDEEDSNVAFTFSVKNDAFHVSGFCRSDGEKFEVSQVKWDGKALSFIARMPSTDTVTNNVFRLRPDGRTNLDLTIHEVWKKKNVKAGDIPETWRPVLTLSKPRPKVRRASKSRKG
jgi:hypothetical protein